MGHCIKFVSPADQINKVGKRDCLKRKAKADIQLKEPGNDANNPAAISDVHLL